MQPEISLLDNTSKNYNMRDVIYERPLKILLF